MNEALAWKKLGMLEEMVEDAGTDPEELMSMYEATLRTFKDTEPDDSESLSKALGRVIMLLGNAIKSRLCSALLVLIPTLSVADFVLRVEVRGFIAFCKATTKRA